jgi:GNAT superfamily N-acetyltransferase
MNDGQEEMQIHPLTRERWPDLEALFGERGAVGGCWCMWWRLTSSEFERRQGEENRQAFQALVDAGEVPGLLAYVADKPVAWCSVAPRTQFPRLERSRILKPVDEQPVWSIVCFFVDKRHRNQGTTVKLLRAAVDYVRQQGGQVVEGYPVDPKTDPMPAAFAYTGLASAFKQAGFVECLRRSETRPIMRYYLSAPRANGQSS